MKWSEFFTSSVGKKLVMAFTGLFLILFLIVHAGINACIFADLLDDSDNGEIFNIAAHFMGAYYVIRILEIGLFIGFFIHIIQGFVLVFQNRARRKVGYQVPMGSQGSAWYKKSMGLLGTLIFLFLVMHVSQFWVHTRIIKDAQMRNLTQDDLTQLSVDITLVRVNTFELVQNNRRLKDDATKLLQYIKDQYHPEGD